MRILVLLAAISLSFPLLALALPTADDERLNSAAISMRTGSGGWRSIRRLRLAWAFRARTRGGRMIRRWEFSAARSIWREHRATEADSPRRAARQRKTQFRSLLAVARGVGRRIEIRRRSVSVSVCCAPQLVDADQSDGGRATGRGGCVGEYAPPQRGRVRNYSATDEGAAGVCRSADRLDEAGLKRGYTPPKITLRDLPKQIADLIPADPMASALLQPFTEFPSSISEAERARLSDQAKQIYTSSLAPAFQRLHDYLANTYLPACRDNIAGDFVAGTGTPLTHFMFAGRQRRI